MRPPALKRLYVCVRSRSYGDRLAPFRFQLTGVDTAMRKSVNRPPTPDVMENQGKEPTFQELINIELIESGEKERLMELLRERLIECGWKDEMKALCRAFIKKKGRNNVTVDDLVHVITPKGRASIPDSIKAELLQRIRTFLVSAAL
ncbi:hypothetical protein L3X38_020678 [Prunus dulcis]|uniref:Transcription and mRNA export factor ENY2 n=5 Tax=Prunus TaxID=3754 RepID=A0AAD4WEX6_PRUDU|nr:hypothetical protein L3X38_020678 [Prunus dulcis]